MAEGIGSGRPWNIWDAASKNKVVEKAVTTLGLGASGVMNALATAKDAVLPVPIAYKDGTPIYQSDIYQENFNQNAKAFEQAWGVAGAPKTSVAAAPAPPVGVVPVPKEAPVSKKSLADKYPDPYDALRAMDNKDFMHFVDNHGDKLPGVGYVENKGRITRVIENPATSKESDYELTNDQAELAIKLLHAKAAHAAGVGAKEAALDQRKETQADRKYKQWSDEWKLLGQDVDESGNPVHSYTTAAIKIIESGKGYEDAPEGYKQAIKATERRLTAVAQRLRTADPKKWAAMNQEQQWAAVKRGVTK